MRIVALERAMGASVGATAGAVRHAIPMVQPSMSCCRCSGWSSPPSSGQQSCSASAAAACNIGQSSTAMAVETPLAASANAVRRVIQNRRIGVMILVRAVEFVNATPQCCDRLTKHVFLVSRDGHGGASSLR